MPTPDLDSKPRLIFFKTIFIVFFINTGISVLQLNRKKGWKSIIEILYLVFNPCFQLYLDHNNQGNSVPFFTYVSLQFQSILKNLNKVQSQIKNMESRKLLYFKNTILKEAADHQGYPLSTSSESGTPFPGKLSKQDHSNASPLGLMTSPSPLIALKFCCLQNSIDNILYEDNLPRKSSQKCAEIEIIPLKSILLEFQMKS